MEGESAFNNIIAILLVVVLFIPQILHGNDKLKVDREEIFRSFGLQILGRIAFGAVIAIFIILLYRRVNSDSEYVFISASGVMAIFIFGSYFDISSAIAAYVTGALVKNF